MSDSRHAGPTLTTLLRRANAIGVSLSASPPGPLVENERLQTFGWMEELFSSPARSRHTD